MKQKLRIYLDNNATTPIDPRVLEVMSGEDARLPLNPSSSHHFGRRARGLLARARSCVAAHLRVDPSEVIFTSGGTESLHLLLCGIFDQKPPKHIITSLLDHPCVYKTVERYERQGAEVTYLPSDLFGAPKPEAIASALRPDTTLMVFSAVNSETGVRLDVEAVAAIAERAKVPLILDGVALLGKAPISLPPGVTGMGFSSHKIHGPKGVGFVFVRKGTFVQPQFLGGNQEEGRRSGTENLLGILGLAKAVEIVESELAPSMQHMARLQMHLEEGLRELFPQMVINGEGPRVVNTSNIAFPEIEGEVLLARLDQWGVAVSHGSACQSGALEPSRVLRNMGLSRERAASSVRFSMSRMNTEDEIRRVLELVRRLFCKTC